MGGLRASAETTGESSENSTRNRPRPPGNERIVLLTGSHLCHNPRVIKEAAALAECGYRVSVLGAWTDVQLKGRDVALLSAAPFAFIPVLDLTRERGGARALRVFLRVASQVARLAHRHLQVESRYQLGWAVTALSRAARACSAELFIAHSEPALVAARLLVASRRRVSVDMEDWFSEDLSPNERRSRPLALLRGLERELLRVAAYSSCPSKVMSEALTFAYGCPPPRVIYNAFPWSERATIDGFSKDRADRSRRSIHWYSQTLGVGRGLEDLLGALPRLSSKVELHLRGTPASGFKKWLAERTPADWAGRIFVHGLVPNGELLSRIAEHDIGFAGEVRVCQSRNLTVTNKMLHYLVGGLAVVASDTDGQQEIAAEIPRGIELYPSGDTAALAAKLNGFLESTERLEAAKAAALAGAKDRYCWEKQVGTLRSAVEQSLRGRPS